jgi:hypothetical protein
MPEIEDRLTIEPPRGFSSASACLQPRKVPVEVHRQHPPPRGIVGVLDAAEERDAGGIDETVETTMCALDLGQHPVPVAFDRDVEGVIDAAVARQIGRDRDAALALHGRRHRPADGAGGAGDQHDLVLETSHAAPR